MKPKPKYTISICRSRNGQFFWRVKARNNEKVSTTGESHPQKSHVIKMAKALFLAGFDVAFNQRDISGITYVKFYGGEEYRLLEDLTVNKNKKSK